MLIKTKFSYDMEEMSSEIMDIVKGISEKPLDEMLKLMKTQYPKEWDGIRSNLSLYIPVLNRIDSILEEHIIKYKLDQEIPGTQEVSSEDVNLVQTCLDYSYQLLEYSTSRAVYNSAHRVYDLIISNSLDIRISALKLTCLLSERFLGVSLVKFSIPKKHKDILLKMCRSFPPQSVPTYFGPTRIEIKTQNSQKEQPSKSKKYKKSKNNSKDKNQDLIHISLLNCMKSNTQIPSHWKSLNFEYYNTISDDDQMIKSHKRRKKNFKNNIEAEKPQKPDLDSGEGLRSFKLGEEAVKKLSYQQIYDKAVNVIPKDKWFDFILQVYVSKAYSSASFDSIKLREKLVTMKCLAVAAASSCCFYSVMASSVFDEEPYLLSYMSDLINPDNKVPYEPSLATLRAFVNISGKKSSGSDLIRALGGNISHGLLFHILKSILKSTKEGTFKVDQSFLNYFYNLIANLIENKNLISHLRTAGLLNIFMEFLTLRNNYRMTRSGPLHLIEMFIDKLPEALDDFIANDGFRILIDLLEYEVDFAINNPDYEGGAPKHGLLSHKITARQVKVLNFLLKLVFDLITNHTGDRMRNLYDSPLLKSLNKMLLNTEIFGFELLVGSVRIIIGIINSEPTAYSILNEAGVIEVFFKQFDSLLLNSADLILELPEAISAISLNINGLARVKDSGIINTYFKIFLKPEICKELVRDDNVMALGQSIDELARHHPELKPIIDEEILGLIDTVPKHVFCNSVDFYQSPNGSLYKNRNESNIHKEDDCKELETWSNCKEGRIIQCTVIFLSSMFENSKQWKRLYSNINVSNLMNFITVENAPFDYALSSPMFHIGNIIKCIDQGTSCHCLASLNQEIILVLKRLHDFIYFNNDNISYFDQFDTNTTDSTSKARSVISDLGCMNSLLYILSDVYGKIPKTQGSKTSYFAEEFGSEDGLKLIHELCMYYRRLSLEEVILHSQTPADVAKNAFTLVQKISHKQGEIGEPSVDDGAWDGTSAKFKNISLLYFHFTRSKFWLRSIFNSLCRINAEKRSDSTRLFGLTPKYAVAIVKEYSDTVISLLSNINTTNGEIESGYLFCILNQLYLTINYKLRSASPVNSMVCICLLQNYSFNKLRELALKYFTALRSFPTEEIKKFAELKHTTIDRCSTTIAVLDQILSLYAELGSINNVGALANPTKLYAYLGDDAVVYGKEVLASIQIQTAIASFGLLQDLLHSDGLCVLDKIPDKIPVQLIEQLVLISKSAYTNFKSQSLTFQGKLYPISPETTCPSDKKIEYLCDLGVSSKKIAMELLLLYGDSLDQFLEETGDDLCLHFQDVEPADWDAILDKAHKTAFIPQKVEPVEPQYSQTYILHNLDDLNFHRGANELNFIDYWIKMAQLYPQADSNISDLLLSVFGNSSYGEHMDNVLTPVSKDIFASSFDLYDDINSKKLSSMLQLLAYLLSNLSFTKYHEMVDNIVNFLIKQIIPENVSAVWFCNALQVFEKVLSVTKIPMAPIAGQITVENKLSQLVASYPKVYSLDANIEETLLGCLLSIETIDKEETALEISKVLLLLTDCDQRINILAKSNMIKALTGCVKSHTESTSKLQSYVINIFRRCMESQKVLEAYIYKDVNRLMNGKKTTNKKPRVRELKSLIQENAPSVLRSGEVFVNAVTDSCILYQCTNPLKNLNITKITDEQKAFLGEEDITMKETNTCDDTSYSTGLMHYLLSELMTVSKKDLTVSINADDEAKEEKNEDEFKPRNIYARELILRNKDLPYAVFLLQTITELLFSYKQAKTEFLTFSKKSHDPYSLDKPRSTALNMLVHRFITVNPFDKSTAPETKIHRLLSLLSSFCIFALVSTVPIKGLDYNAPKIVDPDITFARKFTVDILIKVIKEAEESKHTSMVKYGKIVDILDLVCKILGENFELDLLSGLDRVLTKYDAFYFVKELSDKKFANIITGVLARLDINFPYTEDISSGVLRCLSSLGQIKVDFQNLFKEGQQTGDAEEEVLSDEDLDEGEETPDLLRNSTLGMYDVDDIEDEDDEDDMENDFLDDQDIEIVYSDGAVDIDSDSDMDVGSGGDELEGRSVDDEEIDIIFDEDDDDDDGDDDNEGDENNEHDHDDGEFEEDHRSDFGDISDDVSSVDELLGDNNFMIDIVSGSESDSDEGDLSDENVEFVSGDDFENFDEDDDEADLEAEMDDNSDDDSAILQEWIEEHEANSQRRRRDRRESAPPLILNEFDSNDEDEDPFGYRLFPISGSGMGIPQPSENTFGARQGNQMSLLEFAQDMLSPHRNNGLDRSPVNFGGALMELRRSLEGGFIMGRRFQQPNSISLKSTLQRWNEISELFAGNATSTASRVIPSIVNSIYDRSLRISEEDSRTAKALLENKRKAKEAEELKRRQQQQEEARQREEQQSNAQPAEPIYVDIGGRTVDISGTGIDPEFLLALPEDMREEVYEQHTRERRAQEYVSSNNTELDSDFMSALPSDVRIQLLREMEYVHEDNDEGDFDEDPTFEFEIDRANIETPENSHGDNQFSSSSAPFISVSNEEEVETKPNDKKTSSKTFFPPMVDRSGIAALLKLVFLPQLYFKRESFFKTIAYLCYNKHTRSELVAILLYILQEGLKDMSSLEAIYAQLCQRANANLVNSEKNTDIGKSLPTFHENNEPSDSSFPTNCTPLTVATQAIDVLQYLLENENHMRFHFLTDQDGTPFMRKISKKHKLKDNGYRFPVNVLLNLLDNNMIKEDTNLMDILSRTIQISTRPLPTMKTKLDELEKASEISKKVPQLPTIPDKSLKQIINILVSDECASKVFQQTIASIQNLSVLDNARVVFPRELSRKAMHLSSKIAREVRELIKELCDIKSDTDEILSLNQFSSGSSDQAKLLRVLTALDYLFQIKEGDEQTAETEELKSLYRNSALGPLWGALSDCLKILSQNENMNYIAVILSPLIEALMVVCKHSKVQRMNVLDVLRYEEKELDFAKEPIESLFFTFTEEHKKILNHMIRNNPKLMSGPFSVLVRNPKVLEFDNKRVYFDQKLHKDEDEREKMEITIRRDQVFLDSYRALFFKPSEQVRKSNLEIHFRGEEGVDAGGLTREWYQVLSRQMFDPNYALFIPVASDKTTFHPNRTSWVNPEHLSFFKFVGMIIGKAVYDGYMLDCHFSRAVFKRILGKNVSLKDMESLDLDYYKSLVWMLENDITDIIVETFSVETDDYGEHKIIDLKPDGRNIAVTEENKQEYVRLIVEYRLLTSIKDQMDKFLEGFDSIIPKELISIFDEQELELLISGLPDIDVDDWKNHTTYENYSSSSPQIQWFWRAVKSFDVEERAKLLQFATGTSKVPLNGFKELAGMNGISKFSIHRVYSSTDRLPTAHTCFNQVDLPEYESYGKLRNALLLAIREGHEGFGFA